MLLCITWPLLFLTWYTKNNKTQDTWVLASWLVRSARHLGLLPVAATPHNSRHSRCRGLCWSLTITPWLITPQIITNPKLLEDSLRQFPSLGRFSNTFICHFVTQSPFTSQGSFYTISLWWLYSSSLFHGINHSLFHEYFFLCKTVTPIGWTAQNYSKVQQI